MPSLPEMAMLWFLGIEGAPASKVAPNVTQAQITSFEMPAAPGASPAAFIEGQSFPMKTPAPKTMSENVQAVTPSKKQESSMFQRLKSSFFEFKPQPRTSILLGIGLTLGIATIFIACRKFRKLQRKINQSCEHSAYQDLVIKELEKTVSLEQKGNELLTKLKERKEEEVKTMQGEATTAMTKILEQADKLRTSETDNETLKATTKTYISDLTNLKKKVEAQESEITLLREEEQSRDTLVSDLYQTNAVQESELASLREIASGYEQHVSELALACQEKDHEADIMKTKLSDMLTEVGILEDKVEQLEKDERSFHSNLASAEARSSGLQLQLEELEEKARDEIVNLQSDFNALEDERDDLKAEREQLEGNLGVLQNINADLQLQLGNSKIGIDNLEATCAHLKHEKEEAVKHSEGLKWLLESSEIRMDEDEKTHVQAVDPDNSSPSSTSEKTHVEMDNTIALTHHIQEQARIEADVVSHNVADNDNENLGEDLRGHEIIDGDTGTNSSTAISQLAFLKEKIAATERALLAGDNDIIVLEMVVEFAAMLYPEGNIAGSLGSDDSSLRECLGGADKIEKAEDDGRGVQTSDPLWPIPEEVGNNSEASEDAEDAENQKPTMENEMNDSYHDSQGTHLNDGDDQNEDKEEEDAIDEALLEPVSQETAGISDPHCSDQPSRFDLTSEINSSSDQRRSPVHSSKPSAPESNPTEEIESTGAELPIERADNKAHDRVSDTVHTSSVEAGQVQSSGQEPQPWINTNETSSRMEDTEQASQARHEHVAIINARLAESQAQAERDVYNKEMGRPMPGEQVKLPCDEDIDRMYERQVTHSLPGPVQKYMEIDENTTKVLDAHEKLRQELSSDEYSFTMWQHDEQEPSQQSNAAHVNKKGSTPNPSKPKSPKTGMQSAGSRAVGKSQDPQPEQNAPASSVPSSAHGRTQRQPPTEPKAHRLNPRPNDASRGRGSSRGRGLGGSRGQAIGGRGRRPQPSAEGDCLGPRAENKKQNPTSATK